MLSSLWTWIERVSWWLEDDHERQAVLGDIQECGATFAALRDVVALVLLRQLQGWKSWRPWVLIPALAVPLIGFVVTPLNVLSMGAATTRELTGMAAILNLVYAYAFGLSLGSLGKKTALSMLPVLTLVAIRAAMEVTQFMLRTGGFVPNIWIAIGIVLLIVVPIGLGLRRGLLRGSLSRPAGAGLAIALPVFYAVFYAELNRSGGVILPHLVLLFAAFWPVLYMAISPWTTRRVEVSHA